MSDLHPEEDARLAAAVRTLGEDLEPPEGWQTRVLERVDAPPARRSYRRFAVAAGAFAAAAALVLAWRTWPTDRTSPALVVASADAQVPAAAPLVAIVTRADVVHAGRAARGDGAHPGDTWRVAAQVDARVAQVVILVYRDADVVLNVRCPGDGTLRCAGGVAETSVALDAPGSYRMVTIASPSPLPEGSAAEILDAALRTGAQVEWSAPLVVR